jgi:putative membrane protein
MMYGRGYAGYGNMMGGYGWVGGLIALLFFALVIGGIVLLVVWAVRSLSGHGQAALPTSSGSAPGHDEAVAIAKKRLANSEISKDQYDDIMRALGA